MKGLNCTKMLSREWRSCWKRGMCLCGVVNYFEGTKRPHTYQQFRWGSTYIPGMNTQILVFKASSELPLVAVIIKAVLFKYVYDCFEMTTKSLNRLYKSRIKINK